MNCTKPGDLVTLNCPQDHLQFIIRGSIDDVHLLPVRYVDVFKSTLMLIIAKKYLNYTEHILILSSDGWMSWVPYDDLIFRIVASCNEVGPW
jgi:hypothetical protein